MGGWLKVVLGEGSAFPRTYGILGAGKRSNA